MYYLINNWVGEFKEFSDIAEFKKELEEIFDEIDNPSASEFYKSIRVIEGREMKIEIIKKEIEINLI
jgi:hypothetical protein